MNMMREGKYRILILTDHRIHSPVESIYHLARKMTAHPRATYIHVVSRGREENEAFFRNPSTDSVLASKVDDSFAYSPDGAFYSRDTFPVSVKDYDVVMLRLPRSKSMDFFASIGRVIPQGRMINQPEPRPYKLMLKTEIIIVLPSAFSITNESLVNGSVSQIGLTIVTSLRVTSISSCLF